MKRKWVIPLIICILLIAAYAFRWEQGPTLTEKDLKIIPLRDRWTGQVWIKTYGIRNEIVLGGEMEPVIPQKLIEERKVEILESPEILSEKQEFERIITDNTKIKTAFEQSYNEFKKAAEKKGLSPLEILVAYPNNDEVKANTKATQEISKATKGIENLQIQAKLNAESELKTWAWQERKIATGVWIALFALSLLTTGLFIWRGVKQANPGK